MERSVPSLLAFRKGSLPSNTENPKQKSLEMNYSNFEEDNRKPSSVLCAEHYYVLKMAQN